MNRAGLALALSICAFASAARGGPYAPAAGITGSTAIAASSPAFRGWASSVVNFAPGWQEIDDHSLGRVTFGADEGRATDALGPASATPTSTMPVVSLG